MAWRLLLALWLATLTGCCCFGVGGTGLPGRWTVYDHSDPPTTTQSTLVLSGTDVSGTFELDRVVTTPGRAGAPDCSITSEIHGSYRTTEGGLGLVHDFASYSSVGCGTSYVPPDDAEEIILADFEGPFTVDERHLRCGSLTLARSLF